MSITHTCICCHLPLFLFSSRVLAPQLTESDLFHNSRNIINFVTVILRKMPCSLPVAFLLPWVNRLTSKVTDLLAELVNAPKLDKTECDGGLWCKALNLNLCYKSNSKRHGLSALSWTKDRVSLYWSGNTEGKGWWERNCLTSIWYAFPPKWSCARYYFKLSWMMKITEFNELALTKKFIFLLLSFWILDTISYWIL